jgi:hypothetical protein
MNSDSEYPQGNSLTLSLVERAADGKFFLHVLCLALYLDMVAQKVLSRAIPDIVWSDFDQVKPAEYFMVLLVYSALMGIVFRIAYSLLTPV